MISDFFFPQPGEILNSFEDGIPDVCRGGRESHLPALYGQLLSRTRPLKLKRLRNSPEADRPRPQGHHCYPRISRANWSALLDQRP